MKEYMKITRMGHRSSRNILQKGIHITVTEKIDGANASFKLANDYKTILCFSRTKELDEKENLRGFYQWVQENIKPELLTWGFIYFGEWLVPHTVRYPVEHQKNFYLFDVYDEQDKFYYDFTVVQNEADYLGIKTVPMFYCGEYMSYEHLEEFVGRSELTEQGEGIVIKSVDCLNSDGDQQYIKMVHPNFAEKQKQPAPKDPNATFPEREFVKETVVRPRVEKFLHKLIDEGILKEDYDLEDMGFILKNMNPLVYEDIIMEELDEEQRVFVVDLHKVRKEVGRTLGHIVKEIIGER